MRIVRQAAWAWCRGAVELLLLFPVLLWLYAAWFPSQSAFLWLLSFTVFYVSGYAVRRYAPVRHIGALLAVSVAVVGGWAALLYAWIWPAIVSPAAEEVLPPASAAGGVLFSVVGGAIYYRGVRSAARSWMRELPAKWYWASVAVYFVAVWLYRYAPVMEPVLPWISGCGAVVLALALLMTNQHMLHNESTGKQQSSDAPVPSAIAWKNRIYLLTLALLIIAVSVIGQIRALFGWIGLQLAAVLEWIRGKLRDWFGNDSAGAPGGESPAIDPSLALPDPSSKSELMLWLERLGYYGILIVLGVAALIVLALGWRGIVRLARIVYRWMNGLLSGREPNADGAGYEDEHIRLFDAKERREQWKRSLQDWLAGWLNKQPQWRDLRGNRERIRYIYKHMLLRSVSRGYPYQSSDTPEETGRHLRRWDAHLDQQGLDQLLQLYNRGRYGDQDIGDDSLVESVKQRMLEQRAPKLP